MSVLVDSNVLIDLVDSEAEWHGWSSAQVSRLADAAETLVVNPIIYAEVSIPFEHPGDVEALLSPWTREALPFSAAFLAGKAFRSYRRAGGARTSPRPDFFIGAHALVAGHRLLTRDAARYRTYFPEVELIAP